LWFEASPQQIVTRPCLENTQYKKGLVEWQVVESLLSMCEALSSSPSMAKIIIIIIIIIIIKEIQDFLNKNSNVI
jgi:hypothetical protein